MGGQNPVWQAVAPHRAVPVPRGGCGFQGGSRRSPACPAVQWLVPWLQAAYSALQKAMDRLREGAVGPVTMHGAVFSRRVPYVPSEWELSLPPGPELVQMVPG